MIQKNVVRYFLREHSSTFEVEADLDSGTACIRADRSTLTPADLRGIAEVCAAAAGCIDNAQAAIRVREALAPQVGKIAWTRETA